MISLDVPSELSYLNSPSSGYAYMRISETPVLITFVARPMMSNSDRLVEAYSKHVVSSEIVCGMDQMPVVIILVASPMMSNSDRLVET